MSRLTHDSTEQSGTLSFVERWRAIETPAMWFILMNALDCALTYIFLNHQREEPGVTFYGIEANRIAAYFLHRWGIKGLFAFKLASAVFVCAIAYIVAFKNVETARRLLGFGTVIVLAVVLYSVWLAKGFIHG